MGYRTEYPPGVPCWVDTMQPDPAAATAFYGGLLGWEFDDGEYRTARLSGRRVAGVGHAPPGSPAFWATYVRVESLDTALARAADAGGSVLVGPTGFGADGTAAAVADPTGVAIGLWEPAARAGAEVVNEPGAWAMSALHTPDLEAANAFFASVFGWEAEPMAGTPLTLLRLPGYEGGEPAQPIPRDVVAVVTVAEGGVPPHWAVNFRVEDVDAVATRALELGGTLLMPPTDAPGFRNAVIADPQQGVIAVSAVVA